MAEFSRTIKISDYDNLNYDTLPEHVRRDIVKDYVALLKLLALLVDRQGGKATFNAPNLKAVERKRLMLYQPGGEKALGGDLQLFLF